MRRTLPFAAVATIAVVAGAFAVRGCDAAQDPEPGHAGPRAATGAPPEVRVVPRRRAARGADVGAPPPATDSVLASTGAVPADSSPPGAAPTVAVDVVVRDPAGRVVPGVAVTARHAVARWGIAENMASPLLFDEDETETRRPGAPRAAPRTTDEAGRVRVEFARAEGLRVVVASDAWFGEAAVPAAPGADAAAAREPFDVVIDVVPAFRLSGRVVHEDGRAVPDATVYLSVPLPGRAPRQPRRLEVVRTDEDGRFRCGVHPVPDTRQIECYLMGSTMAGNSHRFVARVGAMDDVELVAPRGTTIRGRCVDEQGAALAGVRIRGFRPGTGEITFTDGAGRFAIPVPGGGGSLLFFLEGRVQTALRDLRGPPEGVDVGDVLIPRGGVVAGRVVDPSGRPLPGMTVLVVDPRTEHAAAQVTSASDGSFRAEPVGAGDHHALVWGARPGEPDGVRCAFRFDALRAGTTDAVLAVPAGVWAHVEVRNPVTDAPLSFAKGVVTLTRDDGSGETALHHVFESEPLWAFDLQFPGPGAYVVDFELPVSGAADRRRITIGDDPPGTIVLTPR